jgi:hypothetical protein
VDRARVFNREPTQFDLICHQFLLNKETEDRVLIEIEKIKYETLLHRPDVYNEIYDKREEEAPEVEQITPQNEAELNELISRMKALNMPIS